MELRDYLRVYWSQRWLILGVIAVACAAAAIAIALQPERTGVSASFAINRTNRVETTQYEYDGYYALQAADLFAQTVVSWFDTPSFLRTVYEKANLDPMIETVNSLPARFSVKKYSAQNIVVKFTESNQERASKVATALAAVMEDTTKDLNATSTGKALFEIISGPPVIAPATAPRMLIFTVTIILSGAAGLLLAAGRHYLRS